ncbi:MAG: sensor histidine kinase [Rhodospirillales bacterium]
MSPNAQATSAGAACAVTETPAYEPAMVVRHIAHELRQPLSTIESIAFYLEMVLPRGDAKARKQLGKLQQEIHQINWILTDAIHFLGAAPLHQQLMDLTEVTSQCLSEWNTRRSAGVRLRLEDNLPLVRLDLEQIRHMLRNIVTFFSRISAPESPITVRTYSQSTEVVLQVAAIAPDSPVSDIQPLYDPFNSHLPSGSGLGLASVRRIAEAHGGRVDVTTGDAGAISLNVAFPIA